MDKSETDRQLDFEPQLSPLSPEINKDVSHESAEQIVATNVSQQLLTNAFDFQKHELQSQPILADSMDTSGQPVTQQIGEEPIHRNIEYQSEHRSSGQPIQQYIYDEEEEEEEEEEEFEQQLNTDLIDRQLKGQDMIVPNVSPNTRTETIDDLMERSIGSQSITKDEVLYQLSDDNVLSAQSYGFGTDLRIDAHSEQTLGPVSDYSLNSEDPFSTPHKQKAETKEIEQNFERFVENCEPFETIATDFGMSSMDQKNNLLDLDSGLNQMSGISDVGYESHFMVDSEPNHSQLLEERERLTDKSLDVLPSSADDRQLETRVHNLDESHIQSTNNKSDTNLEPTLSPNLESFEPTLSHSTTHPNQDIEPLQKSSFAEQDFEAIEESPIDPLGEESIQQEFVETQLQTGFISQTMAKQEAEHTVNTSRTDTSCPFSPVAELVYWRDPKKSGVVFAAGLAILLSLTVFSIISVVAYASLAALSVTLSFRIYKNILQAVQKTSEGHPFKQYLEIEITPSSERIHEIVDSLLSHTNCTLNKLRSVFLVEDIIDSLKFVVLFWCLTYIGSWFNGLTLIILAYLALFSLPKVYELNKTQIDQYLNLASTQIHEITSKIRAKIPFPAKKEKDN